MKFKLVPIKKIEHRKYNGKVYDLEVTNSHSYTVNNIIVHNSHCTTRYATGAGYPQLAALEKIYKQKLSQRISPSIIADGGLKYVGDIAKALKYADMVMVGSMIAGTTETPGNVYKGPDGIFYKVYGGSASGENKGENKFVEGVTKSVPFKGKVKYILKEIKEGLQSACSYVGAQNLKEFKEKCEFVSISSGANKESKF